MQTAHSLYYSISPLSFPLIALISGIVLYSWTLQTNAFFAPFSFFAALLTLAISTKDSSFNKTTFLCLCFGLLGFLRFAQTAYHFDSFWRTQESSPTQIVGTITSKSQSSKSRMRHCTTINLEQIDNKKIGAGHQFQIYTRNPISAEVSDCIAIENIRLKKCRKSDFATYLIKEGITGTLFCDTISCSVINHPKISFYRAIHNYRKKLLLSFRAKLSPRAFTLFSSLFLGEKDMRKQSIEKIQKQCKSWGITHFLARSGLHLVIVLSTYEFFFKFIPIAYATKQIILILFCLLYFLLSWPSISFIRALCTFLLYKCCTLFYMRTHFLHLLTLTCILILLYNPLQLFFLDFQLSFGLTFALGWLNQYKSTPAT